MNIYVILTRAFNRDGLRAILAGGQAVVAHRLAVMSKDGDWILKENEASTRNVLDVLADYGARYRFGAPLDVRWLSGGWSSHFEFMHEGVRVRTDFVTRPPRVSGAALDRLWAESGDLPLPVADLHSLAEMKKTNRERDYAVIGELARMMSGVDDRILYSRSARDLIRLEREHPDRVRELAARRQILQSIAAGRDAVETALDAERRAMMRANEERLTRYLAAAEPWAVAWPDVGRAIDGRALRDAHRILTDRAAGLLPFALPEIRHERDPG